MKFSIITCFHNSAKRIDRYEQAIINLHYDKFLLEFIFVDNASSDTTLLQLEALASRLKWPAKVLSEARPGLMYARICGTAHATGNFITFFDDDNEPDANFFKILSELTKKYSACIFTGNARPPSEYKIAPQMLGGLEILAIRNASGEREYRADCYCPRPVPWGAGLTVEKERFQIACSAWIKAGSEIVGRTGNQPLGGEEIWLIHHMTRSDGTIVFSDRLNLVHRIEPARFGLQYLTRLAFEYGSVRPRLLRELCLFKPELKHSSRSLLFSASILILSVLRYTINPSVKNYLALIGHMGGMAGVAQDRHKRLGESEILKIQNKP